MEIEIERKFLVTAVPEGFADLPARHLQQGYIAVTDDGVEVRVRSDEGVSTLTIKSSGALVRTEVEVDIAAEQFEALWPLTAGRRVEKRRTRYAMGSLVAEVDVFEGNLAPLRLVEVEFASLDAAAAFEEPPWFGPEVTTDPDYKNRNLALRRQQQD